MEVSVGLSMKEHILNAAVRLFMEKGNINTSMDEIAEAVGLTKGGLYHHVEKKEDLLTAINDQILDAFFARVNAAVSQEGDPAKQLENWIRAHALIMRDYQPHIKVFFTEIDNLSEEMFRRIVKRRDEAKNLLKDIISSGIASGMVREDINPDIVSFLILGMINWLYVWYRPKGPLTLEEIIENMVGIVFTGLSAKKGSAREETSGESNKTTPSTSAGI